MPAPPGSPYRSKFVTFAVDRAQRWKRRAGIAVRWAKVGLVTGAQWLLHPFDWLSRASRWTGRTLRQAASTRLLTSARSDRDRFEPFDASVQRILDVARIHVPPEAIAPTPHPNFALAATRMAELPLCEAVRERPRLARHRSTAAAKTRQAVRGLACQLSDRDLVLVDDRNGILNCLSSAQQALLNHHIDLALAARVKSTRWQLSGVLKFLKRDRSRLQLQTSEPTRNGLSLAAPVGRAIAAFCDRLQPARTHLAALSSESALTAASSHSLTGLIRAAWDYFADKRSPTSLPQPHTSQLAANASAAPLPVAAAAKSLGLPIPPTLLSVKSERDRSLPPAPALHALPTKPLPAVRPIPRSAPARPVATAIAARPIPRSAPARPVATAIAARPHSVPEVVRTQPQLSPTVQTSPPVALVKSATPIAPVRQQAARVIAEAWVGAPARMTGAPLSRSRAASVRRSPVMSVKRSRVPAHQAKPASQQTIDTRFTSLGYDKTWSQRVLDRVDRAAYGVETVAESAGDRARFASRRAWHHVERRVQPVRDRDFTDRFQHAVWKAFTALGAGVVTFAEVLLPFAIVTAIRILRLVATLSWMLLRGSLALLAIGLNQLVDYIER